MAVAASFRACFRSAFWHFTTGFTWIFISRVNAEKINRNLQNQAGQGSSEVKLLASCNRNTVPMPNCRCAYDKPWSGTWASRMLPTPKRLADIFGSLGGRRRLLVTSGIQSDTSADKWNPPSIIFAGTAV